MAQRSFASHGLNSANTGRHSRFGNDLEEPNITGAAAHYPAKLNFQLAARLLWSVVITRELHRAVPASVHQPEDHSLAAESPAEVDHSGRPIVQRTVRLR
ncbi:MAG: hypothetical protein QGH07_07205, partial [Alphaproteobacteria bacterium]|nr:hypothetical protein [Alphaproteobacteria bacterium]